MPEGFEPAADSVDPLAARARSERLDGIARLPRALDSDKRERRCCSPIIAASAAKRWRGLRRADGYDPDLASLQPTGSAGSSGT